MSVDGVTHLSLSVVDLERSRRFYVDMLGLSVLVEPFTRDGYDEVILQIPGRGHIALCLQAHHDNDRSPFDPRRTGLDHVALAVPTIGELHEWVDRLDRAGVDHSGVVPNRGFGHLISLRDPEGLPPSWLTGWVEMFRRRWAGC